MTDYQRIENELLSLGWEKEQGRGDHIKFHKEGVQRIITVPLSISSSGRAFQNTCASIRKLEPGFSLGKPAGKKKDVAREEETDVRPGNEWVNDYPWAFAGNKVRYTSPEGRDWAQLDNPSSVMNIPYEVVSFTHLKGEDPEIEISDGKDSFAVGIDDIDAWETGVCRHCGCTMPVNVLNRCDDGSLLCTDCQKAVLEKILDNRAGPGPVLEIGKVRDEPGLGPEVEEIISEYNSIKIGDLPPEKRKELLEDVRRRLVALPSKVRKAIKAAKPEMLREIDSLESEFKRPRTPYDAWKWLLTQIVRMRAMKDGVTTKKALKEMEMRYFKTSYTTYVLKDGGRKDRLAVLDATARDWDVAEDIYRFKEVALSTFSFLGEKSDIPVVMLLKHPDSGLAQYLTSAWDGRGDKALDALRECVSPEEFAASCRKAETDLSGVRAEVVVNAVCKWVGANVPDIKTGPESELLLAVTCGLREEDAEHFERAMPFWGISMCLNDVIAPDGAFDKLRGILLADELRGLPLELEVRPLSEKESSKVRQASFFPEGYFDRTPAKDADDGNITLLRFFVEDGKVAIECPVEETIPPGQRDSYVADVSEGMRMLLERCPLAADGIRRALATEGGTDGKNRTNDECTMEKTTTTTPPSGEKTARRADYLDFTNPGSPNGAAGGLTTRELLQELKARGYAWKDLTRTIVQPVIDDEFDE